MYPLRFETLCGRPVLIYYQLEAIYKRGASRWIHAASSVVRVQRLQAMFFGSALCSEYMGISSGKIQKWLNVAPDIFLLFCLLQDKLEQRVLGIWAVIGQALWSACNKFYFEKIQLQPRAIVDGALAFLIEYQRLMDTQRRS